MYGKRITVCKVVARPRGISFQISIHPISKLLVLCCRDAGAYPRVLGHSENTLESWTDGQTYDGLNYVKYINVEFILMETDCSCLQSTTLYHTKTVTQHLSIPSLPYPTWKTLCSGFPNLWGKCCSHFHKLFGTV